MNKQILKKMEKIIASQTIKNGAYAGEFCSLVLIDEKGYPTASVLTPAASEGFKAVYFATGTDSNKYARVKNNEKAAVHFASNEYSITLVGTVKILSDEQSKARLWYDGLAEHFPLGATDPNYIILQFVSKRWNAFIDWTDNEGEI